MKNTKKLSKKYFLQSGQVSRILIILIVVVLVVIVIVYGIIRLTSGGRSNNKSNDSSKVEVVEPPKPVYETTVGDVRFVLESYEDLGNILKSPNSYEKDITTTERFIKVVIGAQNKSKNNIAQNIWEIGNIVDSDGRNFTSINNKAYSHIPKPDLCGAILKPEFKPVPCIQYYEVSRASKNLKIVVKVTEPKKQEALIDL